MLFPVQHTLSGPLPPLAESFLLSDIWFKCYLLQEASLIFPNLAPQLEEVPTHSLSIFFTHFIFALSSVYYSSLMRLPTTL